MLAPRRRCSAHRHVRLSCAARPLQTCFTTFILILSLALNAVPAAHAASYKINIGGSALPNIGFVPDNDSLISSTGTKIAVAPSKIQSSGTWGDVYNVYRYANSGNLVYSIPVTASESASTFSIALLFAETWPQAFKSNFRVFDILINGKVQKSGVDVFAAVGANKPLYIPFSSVKPSDGKIIITIARVQGKQNPMLSGLVITGPSITSVIPSNPSTSTTTTPPPVSPIAPISPVEPVVPQSPGKADPTCATGIYAENTVTNQKSCCPKECGKCGGSGCKNFAPGKLCCISSVWENSLSCSVKGPPCKILDEPAQSTPIPPILTEEPSPPPANEAGDPTCETGIYAENTSTGHRACCPQKCGKCGGVGCNNFAPGTLCCVSSVFSHAPSCDISGPPCVPPGVSAATPEPSAAEPFCAKGILGWNKNTGQAACCSESCGKCGGANCQSFAPPNICCISSIVAIGKSCATNDPPCVAEVKTAPVSSPTTPMKPAPSTPTPSPDDDIKQTCPVSGTTDEQFRMNVAGGADAEAAMGADNIAYISSSNKGNVFSKPGTTISALDGPKEWDSLYSSHRWTEASVLVYAIPVPAGTYTVKLLFAETYFEKPKSRSFDIFINGVEKETGLDIAARVGKNTGLLIAYPGIKAMAGQISVNLIKTLENPLISGIFIEGPGAGDLAFGGGCKPIDVEGPASDLNGGFNHRAHSVPGGPYVATDFDKNGKAFVSFDGTQSHSHYSDPGPPEVSGKIVSYKWTWSEVVNGVTIAQTNTDKLGKFVASFPLGKTEVKLEVVDSTGDVAIDSAEVEVKSSAENGAYCYYYDYGNKIMATVPLPQSVNSNPKPQYGSPSGKIDFASAGAFPDFPFTSNSFAVRCVFFIDTGAGGSLSYQVQHNGPFKIFHSGFLLAQSGSSGTTSTPAKEFPGGLQPFQLLYFRPKNVAPVLSLKQGGVPLSNSDLQHDSSITLPVILALSKSTSTPTGGQNIQIYGSGFINGVSVKFGSVDAQNLMSSDAGALQITVPPGSGDVFVTVTTNAGTSNQVPFKYISEATLNQPVIFKQEKLKGQNGKPYKISFIAAATYGPDGRLYLGSIKGKLHALGVDKNLKVTTSCVRGVESSRAILGVAFSPFTNALKMYFTTSTLYWKDDNKFSFEKGWPNGKIQAITFNAQAATDNGPTKCAFAVSDVVTGLPVSNHDHGINKLTFTVDGKILVSVGGFTNGGVSVPGKKPVPGDAKDDALGGVASNPLSAALVSCPVNKVTHIKYNQYVNPETSKIVSGTACTLYATGFRNSFGMTVHSSGTLYATDNGPNFGFGAFSTNCNGGSKPPKNLPDRLYAVQKGKFHGHPNLNRKECQHYPSSAVQPLLKNIKSASTGVFEYRSNTFGGEIKSNLYISKFSGQNNGGVAQVKVAGNNIGFAPNFLGYSGVDIIEGPRGEFVMPRVYKFEIVIAKPSYPTPDVTFLLGVHPKRGPASGGSKVLLSGHNFGTSPTATFGGTPCTNVVVIDDESFTCITPAKSKNEQVAVVVSGALGESPTYGSDYWYW